MNEWDESDWHLFGVLTDCYTRFCYKDGKQYVADLGARHDKYILQVWIDVRRLVLVLHAIIPAHNTKAIANKVLKDSEFSPRQEVE